MADRTAVELRLGGRIAKVLELGMSGLTESGTAGIDFDDGVDAAAGVGIEFAETGTHSVNHVLADEGNGCPGIHQMEMGLRLGDALEGERCASRFVQQEQPVFPGLAEHEHVPLSLQAQVHDFLRCATFGLQ